MGKVASHFKYFEVSLITTNTVELIAVFVIAVLVNVARYGIEEKIEEILLRFATLFSPMKIMPSV